MPGDPPANTVAACNHGGMRAIVATLAAVVATGVHHTAAGNTAAHRALLTHADLGKAWITGATPKKPGSLACTGSATVSGVTEIGAAVSPTYRSSGAGPFVSESAFVYDSAAGAARYYERIARRNALSCLAQALTAGASQTQGLTFTVTKRLSLVTPRVGVTASAFRVIGVAKTQAQRVTIYVDAILLQHGTKIAEIGFSSFAAPVHAGDELRIARAAARHL